MGGNRGGGHAWASVMVPNWLAAQPLGVPRVSYQHAANRILVAAMTARRVLVPMAVPEIVTGQQRAERGCSPGRTQGASALPMPTVCRTVARAGDGPTATRPTT